MRPSVRGGQLKEHGSLSKNPSHTLDFSLPSSDTPVSSSRDSEWSSRASVRAGRGVREEELRKKRGKEGLQRRIEVRLDRCCLCLDEEIQQITQYALNSNQHPVPPLI